MYADGLGGNWGIRIKASDGSWSNSYGFLGSANASLGGFGALGTSNQLTRYYIGRSYNDAAFNILANDHVGIGTGQPKGKNYM